MARTKQSLRKSEKSKYVAATFGYETNFVMDLPSEYPAPDPISETEADCMEVEFVAGCNIGVTKPVSKPVTLPDGRHFSPVSDDEPVAVTRNLSKGGRPKTRSLTCEHCGLTYKHRASILRHLRNHHGLDASGRPIQQIKKKKIVSSSPPRRHDGRRFYGGKRPPAVPSADKEIFCRGVTTETVTLPVTLPSRRLPVRKLIHVLRRHPTYTSAQIAAQMSSERGWDEESRDIAQERFEDLRSQHKATLKQIRKLIPVEYSKSRMRLFLQQLQEMMDVAESAPM